MRQVLTTDEEVVLRRLAYLGYMDAPSSQETIESLTEKGLLENGPTLTDVGIDIVKALGGGMATSLSDRTDISLPDGTYIRAPSRIVQWIAQLKLRLAYFNGGTDVAND